MFTKFIDTTDEWITTRTGIRERRMSPDKPNFMMAAEAAKAALASAGKTAKDIDCIIVSTCSPDFYYPNTACLVQNLIGAQPCACMDVNTACTGFITAVDIARNFLANDTYKTVLIVASERLTSQIDYTDRASCILFGDGAGAVVLEAGENYLDAVFDVKGGDDVIDIPQPVGMSPFYERGQEKKPYIHMAGQETFKFAVTAICRDCKEILERNGLTFDDIAYIVPHQANQRIIDFASTKLKVPKEKFYLNIHKYGNTSSASIPIALDELNRAGKLHRGDLLLLPAFGGGLASACCLVRW